MTLESEGSYAVSCEILKTLRLILEESGELNKVWSEQLSSLIQKVIQQYNTLKSKSPLDLELVLGLVRGCEFMGMMPYCTVVVNDKKSSTEQQAVESSKRDTSAKNKKYGQVIGFV